MTQPQHQEAPVARFELEGLRTAQNYRRALIREFSNDLSGRVLEVGAGLGQITELLCRLPRIQYLLSIEPDAEFCRAFRRSFPLQPLLQGTIQALHDDTGWNAILSINVLEHIREDEQELRAYRQLLRTEGGRLNLFVPARHEIYAPIDKDFGHHRRYSKPELRQKLQAAGFEIVRLRYFNCVGYVAWWLNFCLLKKRRFNVAAVRFFDRRIFPCVYAFESRVMSPPFGQSLIAVAEAA
jgi:SAM-dependent methyltransferase